MGELTGQSDPRDEFLAVAMFLERHGYRIVCGYGDEQESANPGGHRQRALADLYARETRHG